MKRGRILFWIFFGLVLVIFFYFILDFFYFNNENKTPNTEFSYNVLINEEADNQINFIKVEDNKIIIKEEFVKPNPCSSINYTVTKINSTINIIPEDITSSEGRGCIEMLSSDFVEINITLSNGNYTINLYPLWNKKYPFISKKIVIGADQEDCSKTISVPLEYIFGEIMVDFNENTTEEEIVDFEMELGSILDIEHHSSWILIKVETGKEIEWICRIKDFRIVKGVYFNEITHATM